MGAIGIGRDAAQQLVYLAAVVRMAEHGQCKCGFRDEHVAWNWLKRCASGVAAPLIVAGDDNANAADFNDDLGRAEHMAGRDESYAHIADRMRLSVSGGLRLAGEACAVALRHDCKRLPCRHHPAMARAGVVAVSVCNERAINRTDGVDVEIAGGTIEPAWPGESMSAGRINLRRDALER